MVSLTGMETAVHAIHMIHMVRDAGGLNGRTVRAWHCAC
jgi:hypothetical protein